MIGNGFFGTIRSDQHDVRAARAACEMLERGERVDVGPMQILENHGHGAAPGERFEYARKRFVQTQFSIFDARDGGQIRMEPQ